MIRKLYLSFLTLFISAGAFAQSFQAHYGTAHDEDAYALDITSDNGVIECGSSYGTGAGGKDAFLLKTNAGGLLQWSKVYGGPGDETALYVHSVPAGGYVFCGETYSATTDGDAFIARTDSAGNLLWWKDYGRSAGWDIAYCIRPLNDGGFIVGGLVSKGGSDYDAFIMRTDANGDSLWTRVLGGPTIDHAVKVIPTSDNGFILCGKIMSYGAGSSDVWLLKTDANGDTLWTSEIGGAGWDEGMDLLETANGFMVCGGTTSCCQGSYDFLLMQTDLDGNLQWAKTYGGLNVEASYSIKTVPSGGYVVAGYTETFGPGHSRGTDSSNVMLLRTDVLGDTLWTMAYGGLLKEECFSVATTSDNGFVLCGYTGSFGDSLEAYIFKTDSEGYSGCNERRAHPDIADPLFSESHHAVFVERGLTHPSQTVTVNSPATQSTAICGGPLGEAEIHTAGNFSLYPNPADNHLILEWGTSSSIEKIHIAIYNAAGAQVFSEDRNFSHRTEINNLQLPDGIYFVSVNSGAERTSSKFLVVNER